jgi:hypothetical protein
LTSFIFFSFTCFLFWFYHLALFFFLIKFCDLLLSFSLSYSGLITWVAVLVSGPALAWPLLPTRVTGLLNLHGLTQGSSFLLFFTLFHASYLISYELSYIVFFFLIFKKNYHDYFFICSICYHYLFFNYLIKIKKFIGLVQFYASNFIVFYFFKTCFEQLNI